MQYIQTEGIGRSRSVSPLRGAILLELLIALAILVAAGGTIIGSISMVTTGLTRQRNHSIALDIAISKMAMLEAGLTTVERLNDTYVNPSAVRTETRQGDAATFDDETATLQGRWRLEVTSERSRFTGLSLVSIRVIDTKISPNSKQSSSGSLQSRTTLDGGGVGEVVYWQLVRLRGAVSDQDSDFREDSLLGLGEIMGGSL